MFRDKVYRVLFFIVVIVVNHTVAMGMEHGNTIFLIKNPFDKKQNDGLQITLGFLEPKSNRSMSMRTLQKRKYKDVFEKNEHDEFMCPYNCPDEYTHENGLNVLSHIRARHDKTFHVQTFDYTTANLDAWIPRQRKRRKQGYLTVFKVNKKGKFECPYNCPDKYADVIGGAVVLHARKRHDSNFDLQTFDAEKADLDALIPQKRQGGKKRKRSDDRAEQKRPKKKRKFKI